MQETATKGITKWVEVKQDAKEMVETEANDSMYRDNNLYIEFYGLNMTVGNGYPVESLIALIREVCAA
jgi:hypothetical protein